MAEIELRCPQKKKVLPFSLQISQEQFRERGCYEITNLDSDLMEKNLLELLLL